ncbi:phospholipase A1-like [Diprion similis]|uniref:phospholipase A1-like n=1 Tax=Diprion similis TaxID=362088 RepID=UPI001EF880A0|nr:phospholipase A1-like [Diprion similis]
MYSLNLLMLVLGLAIRLDQVVSETSCISNAGHPHLLFYSVFINASEVDFDVPSTVPVNASLNTVFIIHGFLSHATKDWVNDTVSALLRNQPRNIFVVDWRIGACTESSKYLILKTYGAAAGNTKEVGQSVSRYIEKLVNNYSILPKDVWIIGHSLGAHVAGFAGKDLQLRRQWKLGRITGLDPAGPNFREVAPTDRLDKMDAAFVEVTHTSSLLGLQEPVGHVDIYFNGGEFQRSCLLRTPGCSHARSIDFYIEAIGNPNCNFIGKAWSKEKGYKNITESGCSEDLMTVVGPLAEEYSARGTFYIETNNESPYCTGKSPTSDVPEIPADDNSLDENLFDSPFF